MPVSKKILLITNKGWSNIGDQVVEYCNQALIRLVMENLGLDDYVIESCDASIFPKEYVTTGDTALLAEGEYLVEGCDVVLFGGAPMFNYRYEHFYGMTEAAVRIAGRHNKPVIFSGIGVELYDEWNEKCQFLKTALNEEPCVLQITPRDDYESLQKYKERENLVLGKVADPAVFCADLSLTKRAPQKEKTVGVVLIRERAFVDNGYDFDGVKYRELLSGLIDSLKERGYACRFLTNGYMVDDAFLQSLMDEGILPEEMCEVFVNSPEDMFAKLATYDGVISTRLHPSIISYSFEIPAVGIVWNPKVEQFYSSIGHPERAISTENLTADVLADRVTAAIEQGISHDGEYRYSIYKTLFEGLQRALVGEESDVSAWTLEELEGRLAQMAGEFAEEDEAYLELIRRKFVATYRRQNLTTQRLTAARERNAKLKAKNASNSEKLAAQKEKLATQKEKIAQQKEKLAAQKETIADQKAKIAASEEQVKALQSKLAEQEKKAAKMKAQLDRINSFWLVRLYRKIKRILHPAG